MIAPTNRLILCTAIVALPPALWATMPGSDHVLAALPAATFLLIALLDALTSRRRLDPITAEFDAPVRLTKDRPGALALRLNTHGRRLRRLRLAVPLPHTFDAVHDTQHAIPPRSGEGWRVEWPCTPRRRGQFAVEAVHVETPSLLGLWAMRKRLPADLEVRVYPNLGHERHRMAALFLNRGGLGMHAQRRLGKGKDFEKLRDYVPGDDYADIHWKATARRAHPVSKDYQIERTQEVYVALDTSRLSGRAVPGDAPGESVTQLDRYITAAMALGLVAERQGDRFGLMVFNNRMHHFVRARNGRAHYQSCRDALYMLDAAPVNPDFEEFCTFARLRLRRRALILLLTNLDDPVLGEGLLANLSILSRRHLILVNMVTPPELRPLFSGEPAADIDGVYRALAGHLYWRDLRELQRGMQRRGVDMHMLEQAALAPELVRQYVSVKQRQLL